MALRPADADKFRSSKRVLLADYGYKNFRRRAGLREMRSIRLVIGLAAAVGGALFLAGGFHALEVRRLNARVDQLQRDRERLVEYAQRLSASRRVAQADVLDQSADARGRPVSAIMWHEIGPGGLLSEPRTVEVVGEQVYFEAAIIKFEHQHVGEGDPQRGTSLAVFRRIFGEDQAAASAAELNSLLTDRLRLSDGDFDARLWGVFWDMMDDPELAAQYGVRVAQCEAPAVRVKAGQVWEVSIDAAGGLNLRLLREPRDAT